MLIPVLGPGCITFGDDDVPLYPWLAQQLVERLGIELPATFQPPLDLHAVACAHIAARGSVEDLSMELDILLDCAELKPGRLLRASARSLIFSHLVSTRCSNAPSARHVTAGCKNHVFGISH
jgi:hypothetical protein